MKIALISHLYPTKLYPHSGKFIQDQFELLNNAPNVDVDLIVPTPYSFPFTKRWEKNHSELHSSSESSNRVRYLSLPEKKLPKLIKRSLSKKLLSFLMERNYDLLHIHWLYPDGLSIPLLKQQGFKTILTVHGSDWYLNRNDSQLTGLCDSSLLSADQILYSGPKLKVDVDKELPELSKNSDIIYNLVDSKSYRPVSHQKKLALRKKLGWKSSKIHILTVCNLRYEKGIDLLVDTISKNKELAKLQFHIIGNTEPTGFSDSVLNAIKSNPFHNIELLPAVPPSDLIEFYQASDFYILPSRREGFNVSILEAASCGLPLLCTDVGGNKEVTGMGTGKLFPNNNELESSSILEMADTYQNYDPEKLNKLINARFGQEAFLNKLLKNYQSALSR